MNRKQKRVNKARLRKVSKELRTITFTLPEEWYALLVQIRDALGPSPTGRPWTSNSLAKEVLKAWLAEAGRAGAEEMEKVAMEFTEQEETNDSAEV